MISNKKTNGLIIINTGNGKGKTTAAIGMLTRALSHGMKCAIIQFIKYSADKSKKVLDSPLLNWHCCGTGYIFNNHIKQKEHNIQAAKLGWQLAVKYIYDTRLDFLILDEINILLAKQYLQIEDVLTTINNKPHNLHIVITGRMAPIAILKKANIITKMTNIKHSFDVGIIGQKGIEY